MISEASFKELFELYSDRKNTFLQILYKVRLFVKNGSLKADNVYDGKDWEVESRPEEPPEVVVKKAGVQFFMEKNKEMDYESRVESFEEVGMVDPFRTKKSLEEAIKEYKKFDFYAED